LPSSSHPPPLHPFPTRRSSDLGQPAPHRREFLQHGSVAIALHVIRRRQLRETIGAGKEAIEIVEAAVLGIDHHDRLDAVEPSGLDRKSTRLNSSHLVISYAVFC